MHLAQQRTALLRADGVARFVEARGEGVREQFALDGVFRHVVRVQGDLVALELADGLDFLVRRQGVGEEDGVAAERDEVAGGELGRLIAVLLERRQAVAKRRAPAPLARDEGADADAVAVQQDVGVDKDGLTEARAATRIEVVQGVDVREVRARILQILEDAVRDRGGVELEAHLGEAVREAGHLLGGEAVVEAQRRDAEHAERGRVEFRQVEQLTRRGRDVGDDLHVMAAGCPQERADFLLECGDVRLGDVQGGKDAPDAGLRGPL